MPRRKKKRPILQFENSIALCEHIKAKYGPDVLLSFSAGKDSIGAWLRLNEIFGPEHVYPVYMFIVPDLDFVERGLKYYESYFGKHILRLPHPSLYRWLAELVLQSPGNATVIEETGVPQFDYDFVFSVAKEIYGIDQDCMTGVGVRARDNLNRWASVQQWGAVNLDRYTFYPIFDYSKDDLIQAIQNAGIQLTADYRHFGKSFDGLDWRFTKEIKQFYPDDYQRMLEWFPMLPAELLRYDARLRYLEQGGYSWIAQG